MVGLKMDKDIFLLLGGNKLNYGIYKKFHDNGYLVYVVDWNESPSISGDCHYQLDVKDYDAIINRLHAENILERIAFVYTSIDLAVKSVVMINRSIGLKTMTDEALKYASSKSAMTSKWRTDNLLNRISTVYSDYDDSILDFNKSFDIIIKPDNAASSRGITICKKNTSPNLLREFFKKAKAEATDSLVVVEEFVTGTEFTVEMMGDDYGNVSVYAISEKTHTKNTDNNKIAVKLHYNSNAMALQMRIAEVGMMCYKSLGFTNSFGHLEILLKSDGTLSPVEIGARSSGFIAANLVDIASGRNYIFELMDVQHGATLMPGLVPQTDKSSMYFFYDLPAGSAVVSETNLLEFTDSSIISHYSDRENLKVGVHFDKITNDNARYGFEILEGPKELMTKEYICDVEKKFLKKLVGE